MRPSASIEPDVVTCSRSQVVMARGSVDATMPSTVSP
jgi:hypothetical protein